MVGTPVRRSLGKPLQRADALERVTGRAQYGADLRLPGMLYGKVLRSPYPHARIKRLDCSEALALEGVKAVVTAADLPLSAVTGASPDRERLVQRDRLRKLAIAHDKVLFGGHTVAAVAALSPEIAEQALGLIRVEYEPLPVVEDALQAMAPGAPLLHDDLSTESLGEKPKGPSNVATIVESGYGDVERGFAEADVVVEQQFETRMVHQGYIEPQACLASVDAEGKATVWTPTQGTFSVQMTLAALLGTAPGKLKVVPAEVGGGFGGKASVHLEPLAVLLSQKTGRPVQLVMDRADVFRATGPASPSYITIKAGAKRNGKLTALYARIVMDAGAFPGSPIQGASLVVFAPYKTPALKVEAYDVVTNKPQAQAYRAPGGTVACFAAEVAMDMLAERLGMDTLSFRKLNAAEEGSPMSNGQKYNRIGCRQVLEAVEKHPCWTTPLKGKGRGRGLALGFWLGGTGTSSSDVVVNVDGTVSVITGQVDLTGTRTTMAQVVAECLQLPPASVHVQMVDTDAATYTDVSGGSRTTYTQSVALHRACAAVLGQMRQRAAEALSRPDAPVTPEQVEYADGRFWDKRNPESAISWQRVTRFSRARGGGPVAGHGVVTRLQSAPVFACHVADVEVDPETGKVHVLRYTAFQDAGLAVNPQQVEGQMQGGASQGIGWALHESYVWDQGTLRNPTFLDYRLPTAPDLPMLDTVIVEIPASDGPFGIRGVGEASIVPPPAALANAIRHAGGTRMTALPMTPEAVYWAIRGKEVP